MDVVIHPAQSLRGHLNIPPDKSICHRAVLLAALAQGCTEIYPWPTSDDCQRTLALVEALGASVERTQETVKILGVGSSVFHEPKEELYCGESGTTIRLATGLLASQPLKVRLTAGPFLSRRPMRRLVEPLSEMGVHLEGSALSQSRDCYPPLTIRGRRPLKAIRYEMPVASAQVKSAILLAGLFGDGRTSVYEPQQTRDHTERMIRHFGVPIEYDGHTITVEPTLPQSPGKLHLPGDFSSAAFLIVAGLCVANSEVELSEVSLNPSRIGLLHQLKRMGARLQYVVEDEEWEPRGKVVVKSSDLHGVVVRATEVAGVIDELPILMVAAACAQGLSRFEGLGELQVKETDRIQSMLGGLSTLGAQIKLIGPQTLEIKGSKLSGSTVESFGDHRTAMSLAVAGLAARGATHIRSAECVSKSFPEFFQYLEALTNPETVKTVDNL